MFRSLLAPLFLPLALFVAACGGGSQDAATTTASSEAGSGDTGAVADDPGEEPAEGQGQESAAEQVAKGEEVWGAACGICHGNTGKGKGKKNPPVVGDGALASYQTAADLYRYIVKEMPKDDPGSLSDDEAWAVTAWIASQNGKLGGTALSQATASSVALD